MLQENSFFSRPLTFFGSPQNIEEEENEETSEEWNFSEPWRISIRSDLSIYQQPRIGLFIHWSDLSE